MTLELLHRFYCAVCELLEDVDSTDMQSLLRFVDRTKGLRDVVRYSIRRTKNGRPA